MPDDFNLTVNSIPISSGEKIEYDAGIPLTINETALPFYHFVSITGDGCPATLGGTITLAPDEDVTCTITNDDFSSEKASLTIKKNVINDDNGSKVASDFTMVVNATKPFDDTFSGSESGTTISIEEGFFSVDEILDSDYDQFRSGECLGTADAGQTLICVLTNNDKESDDDKNKGENRWDKRPTFGINHETRDAPQVLVENGFSFNGESINIIDNDHTPLEQKTIEIGKVNTFAATVYADGGLKVQEFLFSIPEIHRGDLAEMRVEIWFGSKGEIEDVVVVQEDHVIDISNVSIIHHKTKCVHTDNEEKCDRTTMKTIFLEELKHEIMAIKAIDFNRRDHTTYLNEGFEISGKSLNPMKTKMIPSNVKNEGLLKVTQTEKYDDYWVSDDGRLFEMNSFGSFKQINQSFERFQDEGEPLTRLHSGFGGKIADEEHRAREIFDSSKIISEVPGTFAYKIGIGERITEDLEQEMIIEEQKAKEFLDKKYLQARY